MRTLILGFLVFLVWAFGCRYWYVCKIKNHCGEKTEIVENLRSKTLSLVDQDKTILKDYDHFSFDANSAIPILNESNNTFIAEVAAYLKANPDKKLTITGNYLESEKDISVGMYENLGVARASEIRKKLIAAGIAEDRMLLNGNLIAGEDLSEPIGFGIVNVVTTDGTPDDYDDNGKTVGAQAFSFTNMSFSDANFDYNSAKFKPGSAFKAYADSVKIYMTENEDKYLRLTGHTCDIGGDAANLRLGKARARSVRDYFTDLGIKAKIETASEGESNPAYSNDSEPEKGKNRRVVVQIK